MADHRQFEKLLRQKYVAGEIKAGLWNTGNEFVVLDTVDGEVTFQWFDCVRCIGDMSKSPASQTSRPKLSPRVQDAYLQMKEASYANTRKG